MQVSSHCLLHRLRLWTRLGRLCLGTRFSSHTSGLNRRNPWIGDGVRLGSVELGPRLLSGHRGAFLSPTRLEMVHSYLPVLTTREDRRRGASFLACRRWHWLLPAHWEDVSCLPSPCGSSRGEALPNGPSRDCHKMCSQVTAYSCSAQGLLCGPEPTTADSSPSPTSPSPSPRRLKPRPCLLKPLSPPAHCPALACSSPAPCLLRPLPCLLRPRPTHHRRSPNDSCESSLSCCPPLGGPKVPSLLKAAAPVQTT